MLSNASAFCFGDVFGHGTGELAIFAHEDISQALGSALLGPFLPCVQLTARLVSATLHDYGTDVLVLEHAERGVLEELGTFGDLDIKAQIRLIGAIQAHCFRVGHPGDRGVDGVTSFGPHCHDDLFSQLDHVFLINEAHFHVQLGELWLAIRAEILIAVATGDLVVALHAGHHEQLLEQLWGLWQRVEGTWLQAGWHQEVARTLWGGAGQGWGLDLGEVMLVEHVACRSIDPGAQAQGITLGLATEIQVAVLQAGLFAHFTG